MTWRSASDLLFPGRCVRLARLISPSAASPLKAEAGQGEWDIGGRMYVARHPMRHLTGQFHVSKTELLPAL